MANLLIGLLINLLTLTIKVNQKQVAEDLPNQKILLTKNNRRESVQIKEETQERKIDVAERMIIVGEIIIAVRLLYVSLYANH
jgi:hypothetical protein